MSGFKCVHSKDEIWISIEISINFEKEPMFACANVIADLRSAVSIDMCCSRPGTTQQGEAASFLLVHEPGKQREHRARYQSSSSRSAADREARSDDNQPARHHWGSTPRQPPCALSLVGTEFQIPRCPHIMKQATPLVVGQTGSWKRRRFGRICSTVVKIRAYHILCNLAFRR